MDKKLYDITDFDLYLLGEGNHFESYEKFGAKLIEIEGKKGVQFAVWAPNAKEVSVIGDFNDWNPESDVMENVRNSGVWALFIPGLKEGDLYKYAIKSHHEDWISQKTDPYAFCTELRPKTAAVVYDIDKYKWNDNEWMENRKNFDFQHNPISIYEVHLGSWKRDYNNKDFYNQWGYKNYRQLAYEIVEYAKQMGYTHIELLPVMEHPLDESWGYQVINYFAPTSRYGTPGDFMFFIDLCHQNGLGVILDWVPAHFPTDDYGLNNFDTTQLYAYKSWKKGFHKDWGTLIFDYGRNEVINFLISNALFWLKKYHIDGLRVDAVASILYLDYSRNDGEWEPNVFGGRENLEAIQFIKKLNELTHLYHPGTLMIAEESTAFPAVSRPTYLGGLGFDMKWNMGWMNDTIEYIKQDPYHKRHHHNSLTFSLTYAFSENYILPLSHDEVVHGKCSMLSKMPGIYEDKFANLRAYYAYMYAHPGKKLLFMGGEFAQFSEWNYATELDWLLLEYDLHKKMQDFVRDLNHFYREDSCFWELDDNWEGFRWIDPNDYLQNILTFQRKNKAGESLIVACNFAPVHRSSYRLGVEEPGTYEPVFHTEEAKYGGNGTKIESVNSMDEEWLGFPYTIAVDLPPLSTVFFKKKTKKTSRKAR